MTKKELMDYLDSKNIMYVDAFSANYYGYDYYAIIVAAYGDSGTYAYKFDYNVNEQIYTSYCIGDTFDSIVDSIKKGACRGVIYNDRSLYNNGAPIRASNEIISDIVWNYLE